MKRGLKQWIKHLWSHHPDFQSLRNECFYCCESTVERRYHQYMDEGLSAIDAFAKLYGTQRKQGETDDELIYRIAQQPDILGDQK